MSSNLVYLTGAEATPPEFSEEALALRFAEEHADDLRYVADWNKWMVWTGTHWERDRTVRIFDLARNVCRVAAQRCNKPNQAERLASAKTVAAIERLARSDRRLAATTDQWDEDPMLLATPDGTVDLRTGILRAHAQDDYCSKVTAFGLPDPAEPKPVFDAFMDRITDGNTELQQFLQRVVGYCLTGSTREHAIFFAYGTGTNGKSVLVNTIKQIMGSYAMTTQAETLMASRFSEHPTAIARLHGARLVTATETEEGRRWAEARIKELTGGDTITARFMRADHFEFTPQFKLFISGNHKPGLRSVDQAIRRRFYLIPFSVTIPDHEIDKKLPDKLLHEGPQILWWAINGAYEWHQKGLAPPAIIRNATEDYLQDEDTLGNWIVEYCDIGPNQEAPSGVLFQSWKLYAEAATEFVGSHKRFAAALKDRGFKHVARMGHGGKPGFKGIGLRP